MLGTVYLIHFDRQLGHAQHYIGWAGSLEARIRHHLAGTGARLMRAVTLAGISWEVVRTWEGDRYLERKLKNRKDARSLCPACRAARHAAQ